MELYHSLNDPESIRAVYMVHEKDIPCRLILSDFNKAKAQSNSNVSNGQLTLRDNNLVISDSDVIVEYLDDKHPYPPLMPLDPPGRARCRLLLKYFREHWFDLYAKLDVGDKIAKKSFSQELLHFDQWLSGSGGWLFGKDISIADCTTFPFLFKFSRWGIKIPKRGALERYIVRMSSHPTIFNKYSEELALMDRPLSRVNKSNYI